MLEPKENLSCRDCGALFEFDQGQADYFNSRGLEHYPARCEQCRVDNKAKRNAERTMTAIVCSRCGAEDSVPFVPRDYGNVLCRQCHQESKNR